MNPVDVNKVKACFENMEEILPAHTVKFGKKDKRSTALRSLPQMPQLPQRTAAAGKVLSDREDAFEERAAIIEYDGYLPRSMAQFLAGKDTGPLE